MGIKENVCRRLTAAGPSAIQIFSLENPDMRFQHLIENHFRARSRKKKICRLGFFYDEKGDMIDEIFLEKQAEYFLFHLHGGRMTTFLFVEQMKKWGAVFEGESGFSENPQNLEDELFQLLLKAKTETGYRKALEAYRFLPQLSSGDEALLQSFDYGNSLWEKPSFLLVGKSNAGKSSLFNALCGRERVLVSKAPGCTRDLVEIEIEIGGRLVGICDGAGFRSQASYLEKKGQEKLRERFSSSRVIWVVNPHDALEPCPAPFPEALILTHADLGEGYAPDFKGPVFKTSRERPVEKLKKFLENLLPEEVESPFIFTKRQKDFVSHFLETGLWEQKKWFFYFIR
jgi:hypothetical protein